MEKDPWELEHEEGDQPPKPEFTPKAHLWLEGSGQHNWGVVRDCHGRINCVSDVSDTEVVGSWSRMANDEIWVDLTTPLEALRDKAIQLYKELADARAKTMATIYPGGIPKRAPRGTRVKAEPKQGLPRDEALDKLKSMFTK